MPANTDRRRFMLSGLATAIAGAFATSPQAARAIEPISRTGGHHFKLSLAAYSYRDLLQGTPPRLSLIDFIDDCAAFGLDGTELTSYYFPPTVTEAYLRQLKSEAFRRGLDISGTAVGNNFCLPPGENRDKQIADVKRWIEYADLMDAPVIRIFSGDAESGQSAKDAHRLAVEAIEDCCEYAGKHGVFLALENHGGLTTKVDDMLAIIRDVNSPWFGVNMDTGNFHSTDVYGDLAKLAPYTVNVQVKVMIHPADKPDQPSDYDQLANILRTAGYRGYIVLEFEESGDPRQECKKHLEQIREAFV